MKNFKLSTLVTLFALTLFIFSCGSEADHSHEGDADTTTQTEETTTNAATTEAVDKTGKEYTSTFVCPMHCKGSGSDVAGECPACGMAYVASADLDSDSDQEEGHDDHEGHNH